MKTLEPALLAQRLYIVGRSGYGKTNTAKGSGVEPLLAAKRRVGILDPTDSWYGLRTKPDGKTPAYKVVIFGGEHGDLPLNVNAGAVMGKALAHAPDSWIISLSEVETEADRERFAVEFFEALYKHNRAPITLVVDEAETFAPQNADNPRQSIMTARLNQIVKRGRKRGFNTWLITQRPADIAKKVASQADAIVALSLTLPHDKRAIADYIKDHDEDGTAAEMFKAMPKLPKGEGIVWWPGGDILERRRFPLSKTFDSGKTPEPGDKAIRLTPLKVDALAKSMAAVVAERDAANPEKLRARIAELERAARSAPSPAGVSASELKSAREKAFAQGEVKGYGGAMSDAASLFQTAIKLDTARNATAELLHTRLGGLRAIADRLTSEAAKPANHIDSRPPTAAEVRANGITTPTQAAVRQLAALHSEARPTTLAKGPHALLKVLAQYKPDALDAVRLGMIAGYSGNGGTFGVYMRQLKAAGYVEQSAEGFRITNAGEANVGPFEPLPTGRALLDHWLAKLATGPAAILKAVAESGGSISAEEAGERAGYSSGGGTFGVYVRKLRALKLVSGTTTLELQEDLR